MGYNTTIVILNDYLDFIAQDPEFGAKVVEATRKLWTDSAPVDIGGYGKAIEVHHSSELTASLVGGNTGRRLGFAGGCHSIRFEGDDVFNILSALAKEHGFILSRKKGKSDEEDD